MINHEQSKFRPVPGSDDGNERDGVVSQFEKEARQVRDCCGKKQVLRFAQDDKYS